jgi:hypothetical protein
MFRDKMKVLTNIVLTLSFLLGGLSLSVPAVAYASSGQAATPVSSVPQTTARWVRCNVDGDFDADDWCWVNNAKLFLPNGKVVYRNGFYYVVRNGRLVLRNRAILPKRIFFQGNGNLVFRNGYVMRNGRVIGTMNNSNGQFFYYYP